MKCIHVVVSGLVHGVGFRDWLRRQADAANVSGWVKNTSAGKVEAVLAGERNAVRRLVEMCKVGPPAARVVEVETRRAKDPDSTGFKILAA